MTDFEGFEAPKYTPEQEYAPVDIFDIPANQKRLAQPTELRPYNGFTLLGLGLAIIGVFASGLPFLILAVVHSPVFGLAYGIALLSGAVFGVPAVLSCLIGIYQLSFLGFEQGRAVTWLGLILGFAVLAMGALSGWVLCAWLNELIVTVQKLQSSVGSLLS